MLKPDIILDSGDIGPRYVALDGNFQRTTRSSTNCLPPRSGSRQEIADDAQCRDQIEERILEVKKGQTTAHVRIDIGGNVVTALITNAAVDEFASNPASRPLPLP